MQEKSIVLSTITVSWTRRLSLALLFLLCLAPPIWAKPQTVEIVTKPKVNDDEITLRVKVKGDKNRPEMNLKASDFQVLLENQKITEVVDWKSPLESTPPPARIIVLLDFSGSMRNKDSRGTTKFQGAIEAIRAFIKVASQSGGDTQIAIIPFGESGGSCQVPPVNSQTLNSFLSADDPALLNNLNQLAAKTPCASTNLYEPIRASVDFLATQYPPPDPNIPEDKQPIQPRLSVIVLSDGFHNRGNEKEDFQVLQQTLSRNPSVIVHTLGYGRTPEELGRIYKCDKKPAKRSDIGRGKCKVPEDEFVDRDRLAEIAKLTGGVSYFSANPAAIATELKEFLNSILGEYEITYIHPNPERGKTYQVKAVVDSITSKPQYYRFLWSALPFNIRLIMILSIFLTLGLGGFLPFWLWGKHLQQKASED